MYLAAYPLQLPEIKRVITHYYDKIYNHNNILEVSTVFFECSSLSISTTTTVASLANVL